jgi:hypothetical protein
MLVCGTAVFKNKLKDLPLIPVRTSKAAACVEKAVTDHFGGDQKISVNNFNEPIFGQAKTANEGGVMHESTLNVIGEIFPPIYVLLGALALVTVLAAANLWLITRAGRPVVAGVNQRIRWRKEALSRWLLGTAVTLGVSTLLFFFGFVAWMDFYSWQNHF